MPGSIAGFLRENEDEELIQRVMTSEKVSIQVARNLLKAGKLGVGPGAKYVGGGGSRGGDQFSEGDRIVDTSRGLDGRAPPPTMNKKAAAQLMAEKLRKIQEEAEEKEDEAAAFAKKAQAKKKATMRIGSLGVVSAREEEVDPLKVKISAIEARRDDDREKEVRQDKEYDYSQPTYKAPAEMFGKNQDELRKLNRDERKKKSKRDRDGDEESDDDRVHNPRTKRTKKTPDDLYQNCTRPLEEPQTAQPAASSSSGSNHLMSEAEALASMKKGRKNNVERGSASAAARIQRELAEWERDKAKNPEFWKPPKFCLVLGSGRR